MGFAAKGFPGINAVLGTGNTSNLIFTQSAKKGASMKRVVARGVILLLVLTVLLGCAAPAQPAVAPAQPSTANCTPAVQPPNTLYAGKIVIATNATIPPVQYVDANGNLKGMRVEIGNEIAKRLCLQPEWVNIQFDAMIPGLAGGRWDMIDTGLFWTAERAKAMQLVPNELQAISVSVPKGNPKNIKSTKDLAGLNVGVEIGGYEETQIKKINTQQISDTLKSMNIQTFNTFADAYQALKAGQLDAVTSVDATAKYYQDQGQFDRAISGIAGSPAALAMKSPELATAVAKALNDMKKDGYYDKIFDQYGVAKIDGWSKWKGTFGIVGPDS
jgi:polar amino acid transport system substrate-binding protein